MVSSAHAYDSPPMFDSKENPVVCGLKIERNNLADEAAMNAGHIQEDKLQAQKVAQWWKEYYKRIPDLVVLERHMTAVCALVTPSQEPRGIHSKTVADMCEWWRTRKANW